MDDKDGVPEVTTSMSGVQVCVRELRILGMCRYGGSIGEV